jgi:hypothetical protein
VVTCYDFIIVVITFIVKKTSVLRPARAKLYYKGSSTKVFTKDPSDFCLSSKLGLAYRTPS